MRQVGVRQDGCGWFKKDVADGFSDSVVGKCI